MLLLSGKRKVTVNDFSIFVTVPLSCRRIDSISPACPVLRAAQMVLVRQ